MIENRMVAAVAVSAAPTIVTTGPSSRIVTNGADRVNA
jgi:hypothetical protein